MFETLQIRRRTLRLPLLCLAALICAGSAAAADGSSGADLLVPHPGSARLTAVDGTAMLGDGPMNRRSELSDDTSIETGDDGNASMLVDRDSLVELCASTKMKLKRNPVNGGRIIEVGAGTTRIIVDPSSENGPLQISTPAAIATIMGTVVYVTVDAVTGETTISSEDHQVRIESSDPNVSGSTIINGEEQLTLRPGEAPKQAQRIARSVLEMQSSCLKDIHGVAVAFDSTFLASRAQERMATVDGGVVELPGVGLEGDSLQVEEPVGEQGLDDPADVISPIDIAKRDRSDETGSPGVDVPDIEEGPDGPMCGSSPIDPCP